MLRRATALKRICDRQRVQNANIENRIGHAYPTSLYRLVYDRVAESHFVR